MPVSRAAAWKVESTRGHDLWEILCRSALRGADVAARLLGLEATETRVERSELFVAWGVAPIPPSGGSSSTLARAVDWAKLGELERAQLAREMGSGEMGSREIACPERVDPEPTERAG